MSKIKNALTETAIVVIDDLIDAIPDTTLKTQLKAFSYAVKIPYALLKELHRKEPDDFLKEILDSGKINQKIIGSPEFQQAIGNTLQNMVYVKDKEKRHLIRRAFTGAFITGDEYALNHLERLQEAGQRISLPSLQHLFFVKRDIIPMRENSLTKETKRKPSPGYTPSEFLISKRRTTPISKYYNQWHSEQKRKTKKAFNRQPNDKNRSKFDLSGATEQKRRMKYREYWTEFNTLGIYRQGNDPAIGTFGGGSGTVQYITEFGEEFIKYVQAVSSSS